MIEHPLEEEYWKEGKRILGMDEAGRGPLCGPMMVAGVIFPAGYHNDQLNDSKKLSEKKREVLFDQILEDALYWQVLVIDERTIDEQNIYRAAQHGMERIAAAQKDHSDVILSDAMPLPAIEENPEDERVCESIIKGDSKSLSIAAASILAKVSRDRYMKQLDEEYPQYNLKKHKGYPTKAHLEAIERYGVQDFYRRSYGPVARALEKPAQLTLFFAEQTE